MLETCNNNNKKSFFIIFTENPKK